MPLLRDSAGQGHCTSGGLPLCGGGQLGSRAGPAPTQSLRGPGRWDSPCHPLCSQLTPRETGTETQTRGWGQPPLPRAPPPTCSHPPGTRAVPSWRLAAAPSVHGTGTLRAWDRSAGLPTRSAGPGVVPPEMKWVNAQPLRTYKLSLSRFVTKKALPMKWKQCRGSSPPTGIQFVGKPDRRALPPPPKLSETTARTPGRSDARTHGRRSPTRRWRRDPRAVTRAGAAVGGLAGPGLARREVPRGRVGRRGGATF